MFLSVQLVSETEMFEERSTKIKQMFDDNNRKMAHLLQVNARHKTCISDLEETLFQKQQQIEIMEESRGKAASDLSDVKENLNQRCLQVHQLQCQLKICQDQLTEALKTAAAERASQAELQ
jgi:chromosome segregation ATPase